MIGKAISHDRVIEKMGAVRGARSILPPMRRHPAL